MCGIVGLYLKDRGLEADLGALLAGMLGMFCDRGPDSAGFAVYGAATPGAIKLTVRGPRGSDYAAMVRRLETSGPAIPYVVRDTHVVLAVPTAQEAAVRRGIAMMPELTVVGSGRRMEIFKEVGRPDHVAARFGLDTMAGTHGIGHTRMATESAVTTDGAHPFTTGPDQCLVHNGSLSNHNALRRKLSRQGLSFQTENDTEVAAGYMSWRMREGASFEQALNSSLAALDGFYTFVVGTAFGTEYRALVDLPGIAAAAVWEPVPAKAYLWELH